MSNGKLNWTANFVWEQFNRTSTANKHAALCQAPEKAFYNTSPLGLFDLASRARRQQLKADFEADLNVGGR